MLYSSEKPNVYQIKNYIAETNIENKLNNVKKNACENLPTLAECEDAIKDMKNNKSPGADGIPVEFYKLFWNDIKHYFFNALIKSFESGELPRSRRLSVIILIYRKGEKSNVRNYRSISLINCDYEILAFLSAERLQTVISILINRDRSACTCIKGRYYGNNARLFFLIL